jgi:hypothetical protein
MCTTQIVIGVSREREKQLISKYQRPKSVSNLSKTSKSHVHLHFPDENCNFGLGICHTGLASSKPDPSALKMMVGPRTPAPSVQVISVLKSW